MNKSGLTKKELQLEKIVDKIQFTTTIEGIVVLKNLLTDLTEFVDSKHNIFIPSWIIDDFIKNGIS